MALPEGSDENIVEAVVVKVSDSCAKSVETDAEARFCTYVRERAVPIVSVKLQRSFTGLGMTGPIFTIDEENVGIAVVVEVDEGASGTQRLWQVAFSKRTVVMHEAYTRLLCDIGETDAGRVRGLGVRWLGLRRRGDAKKCRKKESEN